MITDTLIRLNRIKAVALVICGLVIVFSLALLLVSQGLERAVAKQGYHYQTNLEAQLVKHITDTATVCLLQINLINAERLVDIEQAAELKHLLSRQNILLAEYLQLKLDSSKSAFILKDQLNQLTVHDYRFNADLAGAISVYQSSAELLTQAEDVIFTDPNIDQAEYLAQLQGFTDGQQQLLLWAQSLSKRPAVWVPHQHWVLDNLVGLNILSTVVGLFILIWFVVFRSAKLTRKMQSEMQLLEGKIAQQAIEQSEASQEFNELSKELNTNSEVLVRNLSISTKLRTDLELRERELHNTQVLMRVGFIKINKPDKLALITAEAAVLLSLGTEALTLPLSAFWTLFLPDSTSDLQLFSRDTHYGIGPFTCWLRKVGEGASYIKTEVVPQSNLITLTLQDLTQERLATMHVVNAIQKAEEATRAKALFLSTMSHEIRTPMNAIIGLADILYQSVPQIDQQENIEALSYSAKHLLALLNDVLDFSKIEAGKISFAKAPFNLDAFLQHLVKVFAPQAQHKQLAFSLDVAPNVPMMLEGDELRLNQILTNLLSNALKFTAIGHIKLWVKFMAGDNNSQGVIMFEVEDTGIGIEADVVPKLFEAFQQASASTTREYGGTGLGLSICKRLIELQRGSINVSSVPGLGSCFKVKLPIRVTKSALSSIGTIPSSVLHQDIHQAEHQSVAGGVIIQNNHIDALPLAGLNVLVVEDNRVNRMVITKLLARWGATFTEAVQGQDGLDKLAEMHPLLPSLILLDLEMPIMDGFTMLKTLKDNAQFAHIPIVALSANSDSYIQQTSIDLGMDQYLTKPINPELLLNLLKDYLQPST